MCAFVWMALFELMIFIHVFCGGGFAHMLQNESVMS